MVMGGCKRLWEGVISFRKCDTPQDVRKMLERFVMLWRGVMVMGEK